ncbi:MAG: fused signal recognition particle receptor [Pseudohongiellaceae bacterium]|jgi:fused signal recognition particle receptor
MFGFGNKDKDKIPEEAAALRSDSTPDDAGFFAKLKHSLARTRGKLSEGLASLVLGEKTIDEGLLEEIETRLLSADVGLEATDLVIENLRNKLKRSELTDPQVFLKQLKLELLELLRPCAIPLVIPQQTKPFVILMVGVNGVGKTTTIGKLAKRFLSEGKTVMLAAGDTFRAAALEQLQVWGERNDVPVVGQAKGADSASVIFDAFQSAKARGIDVLIADTAGRLHNKDNLMNELEKIVRVLKKQDPRLPDEIMLVLDATTGQNAQSQASSFNATTPLTGITLTKLDGTAKGGVVFALAKNVSVPIRFIGIGEQVDDLRPFDAAQFVDALFTE